MKVLITGGAGYIGTELAYRLSRDPSIEEITIYDNLSRPNYNFFIGEQKFEKGKVRFVRGEMLDSRKLRKVLEDIDAVYHLAAKVTTPFADQNPHLFEQVNHWGTAELTYALEESKVTKLFYLSSVSVYGAGDEMKVIDSTPNPRTFYGISKLRGEEHAERLSGKMQVYIIRCGNVYGYNKSMRFDAVINKFLFDANCTGRITINGDGSQNRAFIHIDKAADVLHNLIKEPNFPAKFNLVEHNFSIQEVAESLKELYPQLEMLFVNQHLKLREIKVESESLLTQIFKAKEFKDELKEFSEHFTFSNKEVLSLTP